jgi:proline iminopeptidase
MELSVNGTTLWCEVVGEGPACLCLHGGPGTDGSGLRRQLAPLAAALGLRLVLYDHRGHGRSARVPVEQCTHDQLVADVDGVRRALGLERPHVLGISWGGYLGLMYAARHPDALDRLVVVGAAASWDFKPRADANARRLATPEQWAAYQALWDGSLRDDESFRRAFALIRPFYYFDPARIPAAPPGADAGYRIDVRNFILGHEFPRYDCRAELPRIARPTLVQVGRHDWISPVEQAEEIHELVSGSRLAVFERSGHSPQLEERDAWVREVRAFLHAAA